MDDDITEDEDDYSEDEDSPLGRTVKTLRKELRKAQKELREAKEGSAAAEEARQEIALLRAGLDLKPSQIKALRAAHEGEWTAEAVRATAEDIGFATPKEDNQQELAALGRMSEASRGAGDPNRVDAYSDLESIPENDPDFVERVMSTVAKHGGNTTWTNQ